MALSCRFQQSESSSPVLWSSFRLLTKAKCAAARFLGVCIEVRLYSANSLQHSARHCPFKDLGVVPGQSAVIFVRMPADSAIAVRGLGVDVALSPCCSEQARGWTSRKGARMDWSQRALTLQPLTTKVLALHLSMCLVGSPKAYEASTADATT